MVLTEKPAESAVSAHTELSKKSKICLKQEKNLKDEQYVSLCHLILN